MGSKAKRFAAIVDLINVGLLWGFFFPTRAIFGYPHVSEGGGMARETHLFEVLADSYYAGGLKFCYVALFASLILSFFAALLFLVLSFLPSAKRGMQTLALVATIFPMVAALFALVAFFNRFPFNLIAILSLSLGALSLVFFALSSFFLRREEEKKARGWPMIAYGVSSSLLALSMLVPGVMFFPRPLSRFVPLKAEEVAKIEIQDVRHETYEMVEESEKKRFLDDFLSIRVAPSYFLPEKAKTSYAVLLYGANKTYQITGYFSSDGEKTHYFSFSADIYNCVKPYIGG